MLTLAERLWWLSGWTGAAVLTGVYVAVEIIAIGIGGNRGGFIFITWHFLVAPLFAALVILLTLVAASRPLSMARRLLTISSVAIELLVILIAIRGEPASRDFSASIKPGLPRLSCMRRRMPVSRMKLLARVGGSFRYVLGLALVRAGKFESAATHFRAAVGSSPDSLGARRYLAWMLGELGHHEEAVRQYQELLTRSPEYANGYLGLGTALAWLNRHDEAITAFRAAIERDPRDPLIYYNLGASYLARGEFQDALVAYRRAVRLKPDDADFVGNLGAILGELGHWEEAVEFSRQALALRPDSNFATNLGVGLFELKRFREAEEAFRTGLRLETKPSDTRIRLAHTLRDQDRLDEAIAVLHEATKGGTLDGEALSALSDVFLYAGRLEDALRAARLAVEQYPDLASPHAALGWASVEAGSPSAALDSFEHALRLAPDNMDYTAGRGMALSLMERHLSAVEAFDHVLAQDPDYFRRNDYMTEHVARSRAAIGERADAVPPYPNDADGQRNNGGVT